MAKLTPKPLTPAEIALEGMTREQLIAVLLLDKNTSVPGIYRASVDALRGAVKTYLRMGRITDQQVIEGAA